MMGHIIEWYYNGIAGIRPAAPGFSKVIIDPYMPGSMNRFTCTYETSHGVISVEAERTECGVDYRIDIPEGIERVIPS